MAKTCKLAEMRILAKNLILFFIVFGLLVSLISCGPIKKKPIYPSKVTPEMETAFLVAENNYKKKYYQSALKSYQGYLETFPYNRLTDESYYKIGKIYFIENELDKAIEVFGILGEKSPDPAYRARAYLMAGYVSCQKDDFQQANLMLDKVSPNDLPTRLQLQFFSLQIKVVEEISLSHEKLDYAYLRLADVYEGSTDRSLVKVRSRDVLSYNEVLERVESWVIRPIHVDHIPVWVRGYPSGFSRAYVEYKLGKIYYEAGRKEEARNQLIRFVRSYPKHKFAESARMMVESLGGDVGRQDDKGDKLKIGVILPLSGPHASFGHAALNGVECGADKGDGCRKIAVETFGESPAIDLIVRDSGSDPQMVMQLIEELKVQGVSAIIGPMSASLASAAAKKAQSLKVVLLPITQEPGLMEIGDYIFQMGYEARKQMRDLVYEARLRGIKSFGVFYPSNSYGKKMAEFFQSEVENQGGKVVVQSSYDPGAKEFAGEARQLKHGLSRVSYSEEGTAGFEALFIPDSFGVVKRLIPALEFVTIHNIPLLGTNAWNDPKLASEIFESYQGSFFVDIFHKEDNRRHTSRFVGGYFESFSRVPTSIEALGFDAVWFIRQAAKKAGSTDSGKIKEALLSIPDLQGVTGIKNFTKLDGPVVAPHVLGVTPSGIKIAN